MKEVTEMGMGNVDQVREFGPALIDRSGNDDDYAEELVEKRRDSYERSHCSGIYHPVWSNSPYD